MQQSFLFWKKKKGGGREGENKITEKMTVKMKFGWVFFEQYLSKQSYVDN